MKASRPECKPYEPDDNGQKDNHMTNCPCAVTAALFATRAVASRIACGLIWRSTTCGEIACLAGRQLGHWGSSPIF
jgi:hypothetical protein